jgi:hypothetical protein
MIDLIPDHSEIKPKFYRKASDTTKEKILEKFILYLTTTGFPEPSLTKKRIQYLRTLNKNCVTLWEHDNPRAYDKARNKWNDPEFIKNVALQVLLREHRTTGTFIRKTIRKILNITAPGIS